ncbi:hypothetical protein DYB37_006734 [Aphanomyces astaci]|uniref:Uncharacterized protein n=2 Tax=Aphanomyces astaci TaxID=112090 RepID=A0A3R6XYI8_APHAT|nr:hypothetical protein DYB35_007261 [Aphanomyces astaci]RHZ27173.1 hypothetical protein DYB37_006734 [Aphanomyces astaci]
MLRHLLVQEGVDERRIKKLEAKGIRNLKKMFQKSEWELAHIMDLSVDDLQVMDMFIKSVSFPSSLRTTLPELDNALCGGIPTATITEAWLLASTYDAYVITTNHTTTRKDQKQAINLGGLLMLQLLLLQVVLEKTSPSTKAMTVHKAAVAGPACIPYILTKAGVLPPEGAVGVPCVDDDEFPWDAAIMLGDFDDAQDDGFRLHPVQHASQRDSQSGGIPPDDIASQEEMVAATPSDDEQFDTKVEHLATELGQLEDSRQAARDMALSIVDDIVPASDDEEEE